MEQIDKATLWQKHKMKVYVAAGAIGGAVAGAAIMYLVKDKVSITIHGNGNAVTNVLGDKNVITTTLKRRGHPGFLIKDTRTGEVFASIRRAAQVLEVSPTKVRSLLDEGLLENLGEAQ